MKPTEHHVAAWGEYESYVPIERDNWFDTKEEADYFIKEIRRNAKELGRIICLEYTSGDGAKYRTVIKLEYLYKGRTYHLEHDFGYGYSRSGAKYMFTDGNFGCDCNTSKFLQEKYKDFPKLECGWTIEIVKLETFYRE